MEQKLHILCHDLNMAASVLYANWLVKAIQDSILQNMQTKVYCNFTITSIFHTECVTDLDKLNLVKFGKGGLVLGLSQFSLLPSAA